MEVDAALSKSLSDLQKLSFAGYGKNNSVRARLGWARFACGVSDLRGCNANRQVITNDDVVVLGF